jgi:hypothetical protein
VLDLIVRDYASSRATSWCRDALEAYDVPCISMISSRDPMRVYGCAGKMFLLSEKPTVLKNLKNRLEDQEQKEKDLEVSTMIQVWIHP